MFSIQDAYEPSSPFITGREQNCVQHFLQLWASYKQKAPDQYFPSTWSFDLVVVPSGYLLQSCMSPRSLKFLWTCFILLILIWLLTKLLNTAFRLFSYIMLDMLLFFSLCCFRDQNMRMFFVLYVITHRILFKKDMHCLIFLCV